MISPLPVCECMQTLYRQAFDDFGETALHCLKPVSNPMPAHALAVIYCLRSYGDSRAWKLATELEDARVAVLQSRPPG